MNGWDPSTSRDLGIKKKSAIKAPDRKKPPPSASGGAAGAATGGKPRLAPAPFTYLLFAILCPTRKQSGLDLIPRGAHFYNKTNSKSLRLRTPRISMATWRAIWGKYRSMITVARSGRAESRVQVCENESPAPGISQASTCARV